MSSREIKFWFGYALMLQIIVLGALLFCRNVYLTPFLGIGQHPSAAEWDWYHTVPHVLSPFWEEFWGALIVSGRLGFMACTAPGISRIAIQKKTRLPIGRKRIIVVSTIVIVAFVIWHLYCSSLEHYPLVMDAIPLWLLSFELLALLFFGIKRPIE